MESLVFVFPGALLVDVAFVVLLLRDRRLVQLVLARHAEVFDAVRGRPRRSTDHSELLWFQRRKVRRAIIAHLEPLAVHDQGLAGAMASVRQAERWFRRSAWIAAGVTILSVLAITAATSR